MNRILLILILSVFLAGCVMDPNRNSSSSAPTAPTAPSPSPEASKSVAQAQPSPEMLPGPNAIPTDTRVVVNIPAYRMDIFDDGSLIKSYRVGIGTPEFPLPTGLRKAESVIFNPTWTVPDEAWAEEMNNVKVGETIEAGDKNNPLGWIKIPIGLPNLIHGGKAPAKIGTFASHGCVGLTNPQIKDFALRLAQAANTQIGEEKASSYIKERTETHEIKLEQSIPVELRYETIVIEDGKLHIYKDVYEQNTNTEDNLRKVLAAHGVTFEQLPADKQAEMLKALKSPTGKRGEVIIEIPNVAQKGYPAPVELDEGKGKPARTTAKANH
ncbi:MAG TPA: L,D-transpeptidase family protein [Pyrinomonadaceae bacterium]|nr:L,D-transpeptidase family protein [Pyrinomonadaceae bacterium]